MATALGLRVHSGWAAVLAVAGNIAKPEVFYRARLELVDGVVPSQPFHQVEHLGVARAKELLGRWQRQVNRLAVTGIRAALRPSLAQEHEARCVAILLSSGRPLPALEQVLASHALIHAAEGEFFRDALARAAKQCRLQVVDIVEKQLFAEAASCLRTTADELKQQLNGLRAQVGSPWTRDEKLATLAAYLALARSK